jgi:hypothetical protein
MHGLSSHFIFNFFSHLTIGSYWSITCSESQPKLAHQHLHLNDPRLADEQLKYTVPCQQRRRAFKRRRDSNFQMNGLLVITDPALYGVYFRTRLSSLAFLGV